MKKLFSISALAASIVLTGNAWAQLPSNPFNTTPNDGVFEEVRNGGSYSMEEAITEAPIYEGVTDGKVLPVDPWARARDKSGVETWRGSGQHGKLDYIGEATTYTDAQGQEMIAPEVNRHNMVVGLDHLRKLGYEIPEEYNEKIKNLPASYKRLLEENIGNVQGNDDPLSRSFVKMMDMFEDSTGLNLNNILFNSLKILGTD